MSAFNQSNFLEDYLNLCHYRVEEELTECSSIITSDDVFDYALNLRHANLGIDQKRTEVFGEYLDAKFADFQMKSLDDYERLKQVNQTRSKTQSRYTRENFDF